MKDISKLIKADLLSYKTGLQNTATHWAFQEASAQDKLAEIQITIGRIDKRLKEMSNTECLVRDTSIEVTLKVDDTGMSLLIKNPQTDEEIDILLGDTYCVKQEDLEKVLKDNAEQLSLSFARLMNDLDNLFK